MKKLLILFCLIIPFLTDGQPLSEVDLKIDSNVKYQTIHSFGASDAWRCQFVGGNWPLSKRDGIAKLLFSQELDKQGNPEGIGLSLWRFYIGAGSTEQGKSSMINSKWRRAESFLNEDGTYNWDKQKGQQWFLKAAKSYGVDHILAFSIAAPTFMSENGIAHSTEDIKGLNLRADQYVPYARFLVDVCEHFSSNGVQIDYLSPINEPQWDWNKNSQEGTAATNEEMYKLIASIDSIISARNIKLEQVVGEAAKVDFLSSSSKAYLSSSDQIEDFLNPNSEMYLGSLPSIYPAISGHSYFTTWPIDTLVAVRERLDEKRTLVNPNFDYWQTEFSILEKNPEIDRGWGRDLGMPTALYVARVIHNDLTIANASSWQWWTALSQYDFKDGLVYLDKGGDGVRKENGTLNEELMYDGEYRASKLLWAFGNYSRFIRPGMQRIEVKAMPNLPLVEQAKSFMISGYLDNENSNLILVAINCSDNNIVMNLDKKYAKGTIKTYTTSASYNLHFKELKKTNHISIGKRSMITAIIPLPTN